MAHLLLAGAGNEVQQRDALVAAGLGVRDPRQAVQLEAHGVAALAAVHVVSEREDKLQHSPQTLASLNFFASLQNSQNFWFNFIVPDIELLLVVKRAQPLLVVSDPDTSSSQTPARHPHTSSYLDSSKRNLSARARWSISSACSSSSARSSGLGVNLSICSTMSTGNWSRASIVRMALQHNKTSVEILIFLDPTGSLAFTLLVSNQLSNCN